MRLTIKPIGAQNAAPVSPTGVRTMRLTVPKDSSATLPETGGEPFDLGAMAEGVVTDMVAGAAGPFVAAGETGKAILASPAIGLLPAEEQEQHLQAAGQAAIKGAAFWGSMLIGGGIANLPMQTVLKMGLAGAASGASYAAVDDLSKEGMNFAQWTKDVATAGTFGALTGGVLAAAGPKVAQLASKTANATGRTVLGAAQKVIEATPGGRELQTQVAGFLRRAHAQVWDPLFTSGHEALVRLGQTELVSKLIESRSMGATLAGKYVAGFLRNTRGLDADERMLMGRMLDTINFKNFENDRAGQWVLRNGSERTKEILQRAYAESDRLQMIGEEIAKSGMQTYDPMSEEFHKFILRDKYLPHRFVDAVKFREGGQFRDRAVRAVEAAKNLSEADAKIWVDKFADRVESETKGFLLDPTRFRTGSSHYRVGRVVGLPGYETDVAKILPQYYDSAARRVVLHAQFGAVEATETALQKALFQKGQLGERVTPVEGEEGLMQAARESIVGDPNQMQMLPTEELMAGKGMKNTPLKPKEAATVDEIIAENRKEKMLQASRELATQNRYPRAFAQLASIDDPYEKRLANSILQRQLGGLQETPFGEEALTAAAKLEVITKLSLGAIAQPSQMLSAVMRTGWRGAFKNLLKTMAGDADAMDFAMRSGVILRSIVRESEQSLTGGEMDFLKRVGFTQMDTKSRVFGALQGAGYAEHQADRLASLMKMRGPAHIERQIEKIEQKFVQMGLNPVEVIAQGGQLTEDQLLRAAQTVSMDVNFWGDSLSLPSFWRSSYGRYVTQFKSFGFQQTKLIKDHMIKPAMEWADSGGKRGDIGPLTRFVLTMPIGGEIITDVKKWLRAKPRTSSETERVLENIANAAGFGLAYDAIDATKYGMSGSLGFMGGPIAGTIAKGMTAGGAALRGDPTKLERFAIETGLPAAAALTPGLHAALPAISMLTPALANTVVEETNK